MSILQTKCNQFLNNLVKGTAITQTTNIYLGLLTQLPNTGGSYVEVPSQISSDTSSYILSGENWVATQNSSQRKTGYARLLIASQGSSSTSLANVVYFGDPVWDSALNASKLENQQAIQLSSLYPTGKMPRTKIPTGIISNSDDDNGRLYWDVVGFGLFSGSTGDNLIAYGQLQDEYGYSEVVTLTEGSAPIFYPEGLIFIIGEDVGDNSNE